MMFVWFILSKYQEKIVSLNFKILIMRFVKVFFLFVTILTYSQNCDEEAARHYHQKLNQQYGNLEKSPLKAKDLESFKSLNFFDVNMAFCVKAKLV
jgi:hypothetical protein